MVRSVELLSTLILSTFILGFRRHDIQRNDTHHNNIQYEESVVDKFKSNLLLMIIWLSIINYNS
jgi:hypothetical protein